MGQLISGTRPVRVFKDHKESVTAVAVFPDGRRMVSASFQEKTLRLWNLETGVLLKKMEGHRDGITRVWALAISPDGRLIASGDANGELIIWCGETGESLTGIISAHQEFNDRGSVITSLDFSPNGTVLATGSWDYTTKLWSTTTWQQQGNPIGCAALVNCVRYSPSGELLAIATQSSVIEIYNSGTRECVANFKGHTSWSFSLAWTPDGTRLLSGGDNLDRTIREWDVSTWNQIDDPWMGGVSTESNAIAIHPGGMLVASPSGDKVCLWRLSDRKTIAVFKHSASCTTFSVDGKYIFSGGGDNKISQWAVPKDALPEDISESKILAIKPTARNACIMGDLHIAEELFTQEINADAANNYTSYANRSFIMARKLEWDHALQDAVESIRIQPTLIGFIAKGIALCGKRQIRDAMKAFDFAFTSTNGDPKKNHLLFLIKAEAILRVEELAIDFPDTDPLACRVVEAYLRVQLGTIALGSKCHQEAVDNFTAAVNASAFFSAWPIHSMYEEFTVLFGWDLESLWQTAHKQQCHALIQAGRLGEALEPYRKLMDASDEATKASLRAWFSSQRDMSGAPDAAKYASYLALRRQQPTPTRTMEGHTEAVRAAAFFKDGRRVVTSANDGTLRIWDVEKGELVGEPFEGHRSWVRSVSISPDNSRIASGSDDDTIIIWDCGEQGESIPRSVELCMPGLSTGIKPSLLGYVSKGIALCGKEQLWEAMEAFDLAVIFSDRDLITVDLLLLIKAVALFNSNRHDEAMRRVHNLASSYRTLRYASSYLRVQLAMIVFEDGRYVEAADQLTTCIATITDLFLRTTPFEPRLTIFTVLFGWDLDSLWQIANQRRCDAFLRADRVTEAAESHQYMMRMIDDAAKPSCLEWSTAFKHECIARCVTKGNEAAAASNYDTAVELQIWNETYMWKPFTTRRRLLNSNPSSYIGYELKHAALHGAQRYDEAVMAFKTMLSKLANSPDADIRKLCQQYVSPSEVEDTFRRAIQAQLENAPLRLLNTFTGHVCNREAQINAFMETTEYNKLFYSSMTHAPLQTKPIKEAVRDVLPMGHVIA
ncbi:WD40-repeat-containing domain protein [Suillus paluster]|uniref:WD40-repeat-containing domain protein n=1 Tax=Suillus paluster TaxID=48578 RepID=UPI001B865A19|nr:WD40-repeat-containing domain protein [Suillus paluster]KAG1728721.1 WD40-repeat-containing domain protein [Suillus paluster]